MSPFSEPVVKETVHAWLKGLGWAVKHGPGIAPGELAAERQDYDRVVLGDRLWQAMERLNPQLPAEAIDDAFRKHSCPEGPMHEVRDRAVHQGVFST